MAKKPAPTKDTALAGLQAVAKMLEKPDLVDQVTLFTPEERHAIKAAAAGSTGLVPLQVLARMCGDGRVPPPAVERLFHQTRLMGRGAARVILDMIFEKAAKGDNCPYDGALLLALAKGFGILTDTKPVDDGEREEQAVTAQKIVESSDDDLMRLIQDRIQKTREG